MDIDDHQSRIQIGHSSYDAAGGAWFVAMNTGASFSYTTGIWSSGWTVLTGDVDANGRADVFLYAPAAGTWVEAFSDGAGGFSYASGGCGRKY